MALLALTRSNIDFVKQRLRTIDPMVKSAHLSEAIAAACGFRTNISMVARLRDHNPLRPELVDFDERRLDSRLRELGCLETNGATPDDLVNPPELPDRIWAKCKYMDIPAQNLWFRECQRRDIPYVVVSTKRTLSDVDWDCFVLHTRHDEVMKSKDLELVRGMFETFQTIARDRPGKSMFDGSYFVGTIRKVTIEMAPNLADAIFRVLYDVILEEEREAA